MKNNEVKSTLHISVNQIDLENFNKLYPACKARFIRNAIKLATVDKVLFDKIFFYEIYNAYGKDLDI